MPFTPWTSFATATSDAGAGTVPWATPSNALADNADAAAAPLGPSPNNESQRLVLTGADFTALADTDFIEGIEIRVRRWQSGGTVRDASLTLWFGGAEAGEEKGALSTNWPGSTGTATYGGMTDRWALSLSGADVKAAGFGVQLRASWQGGAPTARVEFAEIRLSYTSGAQITKATAMAVHGPRESAAVSKVLALVLEGPGATSSEYAKIKKAIILPIEGPGASSTTKAEIKKAVLYVIATGDTGEIDEEVEDEVIASDSSDDSEDADEEVTDGVIASDEVTTTVRTPILCVQTVPGCIEEQVELRGRIC